MFSPHIHDISFERGIVLESDEPLLKKHLAFKQQRKICPYFLPSLTLIKYLASNKLTSDPSLGTTNHKCRQADYKILFFSEIWLKFNQKVHKKYFKWFTDVPVLKAADTLYYVTQLIEVRLGKV